MSRTWIGADGAIVVGFPPCADMIHFLGTPYNKAAMLTTRANPASAKATIAPTNVPTLQERD